ncbi:MAG: bifunctional demethylmenaquinone methyltransferase/2-methoxy-6-polyprenyl-1,4-benzoquinol methylase UbiE [Chlamydiota bacterium]
MTEPSRKEIWKMFDAISPTYDRINRILSLGMDRKWRKEISKRLPSGRKLKLLDLATGTGDQIFSLLENGVSIQSAVGIDMASEMLVLAEKKLRSKSYQTSVKFQRADAEKLPFQALSFDAATFSFGIRNVCDPLLSLKEIHRVLKPNGKCLILEFSLPPWPIRGPFLFYLRHILPRIGGLLSKAPTAYRYLNQTIETFPSGKDFCLLMKSASFQNIQAYPMALGGVTLYVGEKR